VSAINEGQRIPADETARQSAPGETAPGATGPGPASTRRFSAGRIGSSLHHRNYRLYFFGQLVSMMGTWMQTVAQSFLVLDLTHSGTDLGLATAARFLPVLIFGPAGGLFADRRNKRQILYVTQTLSGLLAAVFAILTGTHLIQMWSIYLLAVALGFVNVFDNPARQSFITEMVPPDDLANAVTLNSVSLNLARVFGAALGGVLVDVLGLTGGDERRAALPGQAGEADAGPDQGGHPLRPR
jgi:MFS family permease